MPVRTARERCWSQAGSLSLALGVIGLALCWVSRTGVLAVELTRLVRRSEPVIIMVSLAAVGAGCGLLWRSDHARTSWRPKQRGVRFHSLVFYTRANCGLCEEARDLLSMYRSYLPAIVEVDVDEDRGIGAEHDSCVPVVELDGKVRFRGHVSEPLLRRLIDGTPPNAEKARRVRGT